MWQDWDRLIEGRALVCSGGVRWEKYWRTRFTETITETMDCAQGGGDGQNGSDLWVILHAAQVMSDLEGKISQGTNTKARMVATDGCIAGTCTAVVGWIGAGWSPWVQGTFGRVLRAAVFEDVGRNVNLI